MADSPPQRRVLPARERRESAAKRRTSSPPPPPPKAPTPKKPAPSTKGTPKTAPTRKYEKRKSTALEQTPAIHASTPTVEEMLPTKINDSKSLPVSRQAQSQNVSVDDFRSVADSAVLAATLHRSRMQWLCDGVFDKYWAAPYKKKKGVPEPDVPQNNPDKKSMHKLGSVTITIEPHTFDAVIYTVHHLEAPPVYYRQPNQYPQHPPPGYSPYYGLPAPSLQAPRPSQPSAGSPPVQRPPSAKSEPKAPGPTPAPAAAAAPASQSAPKQGADPVIQMLASRAAADPGLKNLMKIVASSKATQDQLKHFQSFIDELNEIIRHQQPEKAQPDQSTHQVKTPAPTPAIPQTDGPAESNIPSRTTTPIQPAGPTPPLSQPQYAPYQALPHGTYPPYSRPPPPHYRPPPPPKPRTEPRVKHIVLEFTTPASSSNPATQDRWLFPEYAVLDTPIECRGLQMLASFFVIRKGSDILAQLDEEDTGRVKWKQGVEYFQPVTMTLRSAATKILETIARAAKPLPEVQAKMKEILESKKRAPVEYPVWRLPKDVKAAGIVRGVDKEDVEMADGEPGDSGVDMGSPEYDDELKDFYGT